MFKIDTVGLTLVVACLVAGSGRAQPAEQLRCSTSKQTFKAAGTNLLTCSSGACSFPFSWTIPPTSVSCANQTHPNYQNVNIYLSGWRWALAGNPLRQPELLSKFKVRAVKDGFNVATQEFTYHFEVEAWNGPGSIDNFTIEVNWQIIGVTGTSSQIYTANGVSCTANADNCGASAIISPALPKTWTYIGHAFSEVTISADHAIPLSAISAETHTAPATQGRKSAASSCTMSSTTPPVSVACTFSTVGIAGDVSELEFLGFSGTTPAPQISPFTSNVQTGAPVYPPTYMCGLQYFNLWFDRPLTSARISRLNAGASGVDCDKSAAGPETGFWLAFLGEYFTGNNADSFNGDVRLLSTKLK